MKLLFKNRVVVHLKSLAELSDVHKRQLLFTFTGEGTIGVKDLLATLKENFDADFVDYWQIVNASDPEVVLYDFWYLYDIGRVFTADMPDPLPISFVHDYFAPQLPDDNSFSTLVKALQIGFDNRKANE